MSVCGIPGVGSICGVAGSVAADAFQKMADKFGDALSTVVKSVLTFWTDVPTPSLGGGASPVTKLQSLVYVLQATVLVLSLLYAAGRMALNRSGKPAGEVAHGLGVMVVVAGAGAAAVDTLAVAGDAWAKWAINQSGQGMGERLSAITGGSATLGPLGAGIEFPVALLGILSCIVQIFLLIARVGILVLLVGTLPISAAGSGTPAGKATFQRTLSWIVAFLLYKPAAALVYAAAFTLTGSGKDLTSVLGGLTLILLAVLALPALLRLVTPMVAAATSGGGSGAVSGAAAGAALAAGAIQVSAGRGGGGRSGGGGGEPQRAGLAGGSPSTPIPTTAPKGARSAPSGGSASTGSGTVAAGAGGGAAAASESASGAGAAAGGPAGLAAVSVLQAGSRLVQGARSSAAAATGEGEDK